MIAVIPTRYYPETLGFNMAMFKRDGIETIMLDSGDYDHQIYRMWNEGVDRARKWGHQTVAIVNDDAELLPGTLLLLRDALVQNLRPQSWVLDEWPQLAVAYPDVNADWSLPDWLTVQRTTGTWGAGGMTGFCFAMRTDLPLPAFDESYHWWYGDDAFEQGVRDAGYGVGRVVGVPVRHQPNGSASKRWDELAPLVEQDRARWDASWAARHAAVTHQERGE